MWIPSLETTCGAWYQAVLRFEWEAAPAPASEPEMPCVLPAPPLAVLVFKDIDWRICPVWHVQPSVSWELGRQQRADAADDEARLRAREARAAGAAAPVVADASLPCGGPCAGKVP